MPDNGENGAAIAIAATFTAEPLLPSLRFLLYEAGPPLDVRFASYNKIFQELFSPTGLLARNAGGVNVARVRVEDFVREIRKFDDALTIIRRTVPELSNALSQRAQRSQAPTDFAVLPPSPRAASALMSDLEASHAALITAASSLPGITMLTPADIDLVSADDCYDSTGDELTHMPYTEEHYASIALAIARKVHALRVPAHKVLALDCDETLWRGVLGEDGVDGISISPGLACLQQFAVEVQARGTAVVCLVSKNAEHDVLEVLEKGSDMLLKLENIVANRINWKAKSHNIASLARALNLGLDSFVFIDDNPADCALMRAELPEVVTLELPRASEIESLLSNFWTFDKVTFTDVDTRRTSMYRENAARQELEDSGKRLSVGIRFRLLREVLAGAIRWPRFVPGLSVRNIYDSAEARYVPKPLPISSTVLARARAGEGSDTPYLHIYADETFSWGDLVRELKIVDVDGGHSSMLHEPFVESLADALKPYVSPKEATPLFGRRIGAAVQ